MKGTFELNLMPIISLLAVCISFLLLTAVWIQVGSLDVSQAVGTEAKSAPKKTLWLQLNDLNQVDVQVKSARTTRSYKVKRKKLSKKAFLKKLSRSVKGLVKKNAIQTAFILPGAQLPYEDLIHLMDELKGMGIKDLGIAPL
ncbi:MAG: hypothetical protein D6797_06230 [Bdellovibrio sp.]|nr:MAG: hypothetical protein D6797_06230 [Bdellovibrio sp.]